MTFITRVPRVDTAFSNIFYDETGMKEPDGKRNEEERKKREEKERRDSTLFSLINKKEIFHRY